MPPLPMSAAWRHIDARDGFEVVFLSEDHLGHHLHGHTAAVEDSQAFSVEYMISVDHSWATRSVQLLGHAQHGQLERRLESDGRGRWQVDGVKTPELDGCVDIDLEASVCTNMLPVHRLGLAVGREADAPAVFVTAVDLHVVRLEQHYLRLEEGPNGHRYDYQVPAFDFRCTLDYDRAGLLLTYPGLAVRAL